MNVEKTQLSEVVTKETIHKLQRVLSNEQEYLRTMRSLWQTRQGIHDIMQKREDLRETIEPQFNALNNLIDALLNRDLKHPIYG